jgi:hypothetical protein
MKEFLDTAESSASLLPSFDAFASDATSRKLQGSNSPLENEILANAKRLQTDELHGLPLARRAVEEAHKERGESRARQIEQYCLAEGERAGPICRAASEAIKQADLSKIVEPLLKRETPRLPAKRRRVDLDEDLTKPK